MTDTSAIETYFIFSFINIAEAIAGTIITLTTGSLTWMGIAAHASHSFCVTVLAVWMWASYSEAAAVNNET